MAAPDATYDEVLQAAHTQGVGFRFRGFEVTGKQVVDGAGANWSATMTVAKAGTVWTVTYLTQSSGIVGRVISVYDDQGQRWVSDDAGGWKAEG